MTLVILKSLALCTLLNATPYAGSPAKAKHAEMSRDAGAAALTPMDQSNSDADVALTQKIRQAVMADDRLSMTAKNVKIITRGAEVTLRGEVKSATERDAICGAAKKVAGNTHVTDELEIRSN